MKTTGYVGLEIRRNVEAGVKTIVGKGRVIKINSLQTYEREWECFKREYLKKSEVRTEF